MKNIPSALQQHYDSASTTVSHALKITRVDGAVYGFTSHTQSVTIAGVLYDAAQGLQVSGIAYTDGLEVNNLELTTLDDGSLFSRADILGNVWQSARFELFAYNYASPSDGVDYKLAGLIGGVKLNKGEITLEFRSLQQYLQQPVGIVTSKTCRARFADFPEPRTESRCKLNAAAYTDSLVVSAVVSRKEFAVSRPSGFMRQNGYYENGIVTWRTGNNLNLRAKVKEYAASPTMLVLISNMPHAIQIGDELLAIAGCKKRQEDCKAFGNILNFQGEPDIIGIDAMTAPANVL